MRIAALLSTVLLGLPVFAHTPEDTTYKAFQFPAGHEPQMDGNAIDWSLVPAEYFHDFTLYEERHRDGAATDTSDLHIRRAAVGWSKSTNRLYFIAELYDDVWRFHKDHPDSLDTHHSRMTGAHVHGSDMWEIVIDADHGGDKVIGFADRDEAPHVELRHRSAYTQNYHLYTPPVNGHYWHWLWGKALWTKEERYSAVGWSGDIAHLGSGTLIYECYLTPFDDLHPAGPHQSRLHRLSEGNIIGLSWAFLDADTSATTYDAFWTFSQDARIYCSGEYLSDFELMPVEEGLFDKE